MSKCVVQCGDQQKKLLLYVVKGHGPSLLGREWLRSIQLNWMSIGQVTVDTGPTMEQVLWKYGHVFREELGTMQNIKAELKVLTGAKPRFHRPRLITALTLHPRASVAMPSIDPIWKTPIYVV